MSRRLDDDLFPDGAARKIIDVVNLIEDDVADALEALGILIDEVAQDFRRHDHDRRQRVDRVLTSDETHVPLPMLAPVVAELLVRKRLQGGGVDRARVDLEGPQYRIVGDHGLA